MYVWVHAIGLGGCIMLCRHFLEVPDLEEGTTVVATLYTCNLQILCCNKPTFDPKHMFVAVM